MRNVLVAVFVTAIGMTASFALAGTMTLGTSDSSVELRVDVDRLDGTRARPISVTLGDTDTVLAERLVGLIVPEGGLIRLYGMADDGQGGQIIYILEGDCTSDSGVVNCTTSLMALWPSLNAVQMGDVRLSLRASPSEGFNGEFEINAVRSSAIPISAHLTHDVEFEQWATAFTATDDAQAVRDAGERRFRPPPVMVGLRNRTSNTLLLWVERFDGSTGQGAVIMAECRGGQRRGVTCQGNGVLIGRSPVSFDETPPAASGDSAIVETLQLQLPPTR